MATLAFRLTKPRHTLASAIVQIMPKRTLDISRALTITRGWISLKRWLTRYIRWTMALTTFVIRISRWLAKEPSALTFTLTWVPNLQRPTVVLLRTHAFANFGVLYTREGAMWYRMAETLAELSIEVLSRLALSVLATIT